MQETVAEKSLFSSVLDFIDAQEKKIEDERQLREEKYMRRTQRLYDFHERQVREADSLRQCVDLVSQHALVLETALREPSGGEQVPLAAALVRQAGALQRVMTDCLRDASAIRRVVAIQHQPQLDNVLAKMERSVSRWSGVVQLCADVSCRSESLVENLLNMIAEQKRCAREVADSNVFAALCAPAPTSAPAASRDAGDDGRDPLTSPPTSSPLENSGLSRAICSTPITKQ